MASTAFAAENSIAADEAASCEISADAEDLSGQLFTEIFGDGSAYQITALELSDDNSAAAVTYIAAEDCTLALTVFNEASGQAVLGTEVEVAAGTQTVSVALDGSLPEYFWIDAVLSGDGEDYSQPFSYCDQTLEYQQFMDLTASDSAYVNNVVLDYGADAEGNDNFAVVSEDVKVIYVDSMDDVAVQGDENKDAALFSLLEQSEGYVFTDVVNEDVLTSLDSGDKVLIFPMDDINNARVLTVDTTEEVAVLFSNGEVGTGVEVTASDAETELDDYFDVIRINVTVEADTEDVDTSQRDEDVELVDEEVVDPAAVDEELTADLFASKDMDKTASKSFTVKFSKGPVTVKDTVTIKATISLNINYKTTLKIPTKLNSVTAKTTLNAKNVFNVHSTKGYDYKPSPKKIGTIPIGTVAGVDFTVPVYLTFSAGFGSTFDYTATQTASSTIKITYKSGSYSSSVSKSASSTKEIQTESKAYVSIGVKPVVKASFLSVVEISFAGEVGLKATGTLQSANWTSTYRHEDVKACLTVVLSLYVTPSFELSLCDKTLADKTWKTSSSTLMTFYAHWRASGGWSYGTGNCPYRKHLVTLTVQDKNKKAISGATVKEGSRTLGTTKNGKLSLWLSMAHHVLKISKNYYTTATSSFTVSSAASKTVTLYKSGANETYFVMDDLLALTDDEFIKLITPVVNETTGLEETDSANTIFQIEDADDLQALAEFTARTDRTTKGLRFVLNNASSSIDLSNLAWTPIGTEAQPFQGELDGNGFTITGLTVNTNGDYAGLFGCIEGALIHDLALSDAAVSGGSYTGVLAGKAAAGTHLYDIAVTGGSVSGGNHTGGILGSMEQAELLNSYSTADVTGSSNVGGVAGSFAYTNTLGQLTNCYSIAELSGTDQVGGICGTLSYSETTQSTEEEAEETAYSVGVQYAYYLDSMADCAANADGVELVAYAITEEQASGTSDESLITEEANHANALTLLDALNNWYAENGAYTAESSTDTSSDASSEEVTESEGEAIPEASVNDYYNHWYADGADADGGYSNDRYPIFGQKEAVYPLTVHYVYEDGSEAFPSVTLYLVEGQPYDVDSYVIEGYHFNEDAESYTGNMPAHELEYRVIYISNDPCDATMTALSTIETGAVANESYSISSAAELALLADYVNAGKNTEGVTFQLLNSIDLPDDSDFTSIGTQASPFKGIFDGDYLAINNLKHSLFGYIDGAVITSLTTEATISADNENVGGIAANAANSEILSCVVVADITGSATAAGGIVGYADKVTVDRCSVSGTISISRDDYHAAGGIAGSMYASTMTNCDSSASISASSVAGGLVSDLMNGSSIFNCYTTGAVNGQWAGGIAGAAIGDAVIQNVYQTGTVTGTTVDSAFGDIDNDLPTIDSVWTLSASKIEGVETFESTADGVSALASALNAWLLAENNETYLTWSEVTSSTDEAELSTTAVEPPVFGSAYTTWLPEFSLEDGILTYEVYDTYCSAGTIFIALYSQSGQMLSILEVEILSDRVEVDADTNHARAFVITDGGAPMSVSVTSK